MPIRVGAPCRLDAAQYRRRINQDVDFVIVGPILDPLLVSASLEDLGSPSLPVWAMTAPGVSGSFVDRLRSMGAAPVTETYRNRADVFKAMGNRELPWQLCGEVIDQLEDWGCEAAVLVGLRFESLTVGVPAWLAG